jgi:Homeodomain-like domain
MSVDHGTLLGGRLRPDLSRQPVGVDRVELQPPGIELARRQVEPHLAVLGETDDALDQGQGHFPRLEVAALEPLRGEGEHAEAGVLAAVPVFLTLDVEVAGIAQARKEGRSHGRPRTASLKAEEVLRLKAQRLSHSEIARRLGIGRTSVRRIVAAG